MAEVTIRFRHNRKTGKNEIVIGYESDADLLPHEHERDHRALAEELIGRKLDDDMETLIVERVEKKEMQALEGGDTISQKEGLKES